MESVLQGQGFSVRASKFDYFFGRVQSEANRARSLQNRQDLGQLGIADTETGHQYLLSLFHRGLSGTEISRRQTPYGLNITRTIPLTYQQTQGELQIIYFYPNAD